MSVKTGVISAVVAGLAAGLVGAPKRRPGGMYLRIGELVLRKCDPSQHNTLRLDQVERRRKVKRKAAMKLPRYRYRKDS